MNDYRKTRYRHVYYRGDVLYFRFRDENKRWQERRYGEGNPYDASQAQVVAQERANGIEHGNHNPITDLVKREAARPIAVQIKAWKEHLEAKGDSKHHVKIMVRWVEQWAKESNVSALSAGTPESVTRWIASHSGWSARTANYSRRAILSFYRWAADYNRILGNPMKPGLIPKRNEQADRRRPVRAMDPEDLARLIDRVPSERAAFYLICAMTGLRWTETSRLLWGNLDLSGGILTIRASQSKNAKDADLPLPEPVVEALRRIGPLEPDERVFRGKVTRRTWERDLEIAGLEYIQPRCLRMTFGTMLKKSGVDLRDAQRLLRHSDPKLTANLYTDIRLQDLRAAVSGISTAFQQGMCEYRKQRSTTTRTSDSAQSA